MDYLSKNTYMENNKLFYNDETKTWKCTVCNKIAQKYKWKQMIMRINATNNNTRKL